MIAASLAAAALLFAVIGGGALAQDPGAPAPRDEAAVTRGKALYARVGCFSCHGTVGQGGVGPMSGPRIAGRDDLPIEAFDYMLRNPVAAMPPYSEKALSAEQVADLHIFLSGAFTPSRMDDVPMLRSQSGN